MNKLNRVRTAALAAAVLGAAALTVGTDSAMAQMRMHGSMSGTHGSFRSGGWHGGFHGFRGTRPAFNHRAFFRGGRFFHPGFRSGVAVGFYGGYPYYGYPYYGYPYGYDGYYPYGGYYGDSYDSCDPYSDYDGEDCDD